MAYSNYENNSSWRVMEHGREAESWASRDLFMKKENPLGKFST